MADLSPTMEDYIEAIYQLSTSGSGARLTDVAVRLRVTKASANRALATLKSLGLAEAPPYGQIRLTDLGHDRAVEVSRRHRLLKRFLIDVLGVSEPSADCDCCLMEHAVGEETIAKLEEFMRGWNSPAL